MTKSFFWLFLVFLLSMQTSFANDPLSVQRQTYKKAQQAIQRNNQRQFQDELAKLNDYPLKVYLEYQYLRKQLRKNAYDKRLLVKTKNFFNLYADTPYFQILQRYQLNYLGKNQQWKSYLKAYQDYQKENSLIHPLTSQAEIKRYCYYLSALYQSDKKSALDKVANIWTNGFSLPKSCDAILSAWQKTPAATRKLRWQRIELSMQAGNLSLAKYLAKPLKLSDRLLLKKWQELYRKPQSWLDSALLNSKHFKQSAILQNLLQRLAKKDPDEAVRQLALDKVKRIIDIHQLNIAPVARIIGTQYSYKNHPLALTWLEKSDYQHDINSQQRILRAAIREKDWDKYLELLKLCSIELQDKERWQYWKARSLEQLGQLNQAKLIYKKLSGTRNYYGFLAADRIQAPYSMQYKPLKADQKYLEQLEQSVGIQRAHECFNLKDIICAKREWYYIINALDDKDKINAALLAESWGWHETLIYTLALAGEKDDIVRRFPLAFKQMVEPQAKKYQLDEAYIYAVIRRESAFSDKAYSHAGAMGLMQLMPRTAKSVAKKMNIHYKNKSVLFLANKNIQMGSFYLRSMFDRNNERQILASASYNAGKHRVNRWLPDEPMAADIWIETIPFKETREYVSAILSYTAIYEYRLSQSITRLADKMNHIQSSYILSQRQQPGSDKAL